MAGFLALPREVLSQDPQTGWFPGDFLTASIYVALCNKANWRDAAGVLPKQKAPLKVGQLVLSEREFASEHGLTRKRFRRVVEKLTKLRKLVPHKGPHGTIITICDYDKIYLDTEDEGTTKGTTRGPQGAHAGTYQDKETRRQGDNRESEQPAAPPPTPRKLSFSEWDMMAAKWLQKAIVMHNPQAVRAQKANLEKWADVFRRMREQDGLNEDQITVALRHTFEADSDTFWRSVIQSPEKFRAKWDQLTAKMHSKAKGWAS